MSNFPTVLITRIEPTSPHKEVIKAWLEEKGIDPAEVSAVRVREVVQSNGSSSWAAEAELYRFADEPAGRRLMPGYRLRAGFIREPETELDAQLVVIAQTEGSVPFPALAPGQSWHDVMNGR